MSRIGVFPRSGTGAVADARQIEGSNHGGREVSLLVLHDPPYGTERSYNGLRLATELAKREGIEVCIFLIGDADACAVAGQHVPNGCNNLERVIKAAAHGAEVGCCCGSERAR